MRRSWACPPEGGAAATPNSTLLHSETLCPELVLALGGDKGTKLRIRLTRNGIRPNTPSLGKRGLFEAPLVRRWEPSCRLPQKSLRLIPFAIKSLLNGGRFWRRPALRAGRRLSMGPPPAFGGRRPHKIPPTRIQITQPPLRKGFILPLLRLPVREKGLYTEQRRLFRGVS